MKVSFLLLIIIIGTSYIPKKSHASPAVDTPSAETVDEIDNNDDTEEVDRAKRQPKIVSVKLKNIDDVYYIGEILVGSSKQKIKVLFDTGSPDVFVASKDICITNASYCDNHGTYNNKKSRTYVDLHQNFSLTYYSGDITGEVVQDQITVGGVTIKNHKFGEATSIDPSTMEEEFSGLVGLTFTYKTTFRAINVLDDMYEQGLIPKKMFAFYLDRCDKKSELTLGGVKEEFFTGAITYAPLFGEFSWKTELEKIVICKYEVSGYSVVQFDSGSLQILGPKEDFDKINKAIQAVEDEETGDFYVDCNILGHLPNVTFHINKHSYPIGPEEYILKVQEGSKTRCLSAFVGFDPFLRVVIGDVFMKKYYTIFDAENYRFGFALAV